MKNIGFVILVLACCAAGSAFADDNASLVSCLQTNVKLLQESKASYNVATVSGWSSNGDEESVLKPGVKRNCEMVGGILISPVTCTDIDGYHATCSGVCKRP